MSRFDRYPGSVKTTSEELPSDLELQAALQERRQRVDTDFFDLSLRELVRMVDEDELQARPEYQRKFRWTEKTPDTCRFRCNKRKWLVGRGRRSPASKHHRALHGH